MFNKINNQLKEAMLKKDVEYLSFLRTIKSRITEYLVRENLFSRDNVSDDVVISVIKSYKKSLKRAIDDLSFDKKKAEKLINEYSKEMCFCDRFLPQEDFSELQAIVKKAISDLNITDEKQVGKAIGFIMKNNKGFDGSIVKELVLKEIKGA